MTPLTAASETLPGRGARRLDGLIERDGDACVWCGRRLWRRDLNLEHLCPHSRGGATGAENLLVACRRCNRDRRSKSPGAFARERELEGYAPRREVIAAGLQRLSASPRRLHREYAKSQLRHL